MGATTGCQPPSSIPGIQPQRSSESRPSPLLEMARAGARATPYIGNVSQLTRRQANMSAELMPDVGPEFSVVSSHFSRQKNQEGGRSPKPSLKSLPHLFVFRLVIGSTIRFEDPAASHSPLYGHQKTGTFERQSGGNSHGRNSREKGENRRCQRARILGTYLSTWSACPGPGAQFP